MNTIPLTEAQIREHTTPQSFQRGMEYYRSDSVLSVTQHGSHIGATVEGSEMEPYQISIGFNAKGVNSAICDCEYDYEGWCKHIVATLLYCLHEADAVVEKTPLEELLAPLDAEALRGLLLRLAESRPGFAAVIEAEIPRPPKQASVVLPDGQKVSAPPIDPKPYQKQVKAILRDALRHIEEYYDEDDPLDTIASEMDEILQEAADYNKAGDARNAAILLETMSDGLLDELDDLREYTGGENVLFRDIGIQWIEAMLLGDWTPDEHASWTKRLRKWDKEFNDWGAGETFEAAVNALAQGMNDPILTPLLRGEGVVRGAWKYQTPDFMDSIATVRISLLERQGHIEEAANLALAAGQDSRYLALLVGMGRVTEAVAYARKHLQDVSSLYKLALLLAEKGHASEALTVGEQGLNANEPEYAGSSFGVSRDNTRRGLAGWLLDYAQEHQQPDLALQAALIHIKADPTLTVWHQLPKLAGEQWETLKTELLAYLLELRGYYINGPVEIFLSEGLYAEALNAAEKYSGHELVARVADIVVATLPAEVIAISRRRAEDLINSKKSHYYYDAVQWLKRAKLGYETLGEQATWKTYIAEIKEEHRRKSSLTPLLKGL